MYQVCAEGRAGADARCNIGPQGEHPTLFSSWSYALTVCQRPEQHDVSLAIVRRNHPLLPLINLEAETSGLVDRLLAVLQEQSSDPLVIDATMNCLAVLIKTRPVIQNKILAALLNYNPFRLANTPITPRVMVVMKSLERTTRALLKFVTRIMPQHPMREKIDLYINRLQETRLVVLSGKPAQKRPAEPNDGLDHAKRQKLEQGVQVFPPMPPPPHTLAQVFTLTDDKALAAFDAKVLPDYLVSQIAAALMQHIDSKTMDLAVEEVRQRFVMIREMAKALPVEGAMPAGTDEEEYDPEALNAATETSTAPVLIEPPSLPALELETFELPRPLPMTDLEINRLSDMTVSRLFATALENDRPADGRIAQQRQGINRLAASSNDRDSWMITMIRVAARAPAGLDKLVELRARSETDEDGSETPDEGEIDDQQINLRVSPVATRIRDSIFKYILDDWHARLPLAVTWLTEEWYADRIAAVGLSNGTTATTKDDVSTPNYDLWVQRLLEYILPRIDATDHKHLVRTASELPSISRSMLRQMKVLFRDPATLKIGNMAFQYLYLMRPPTRDLVVDTMQEIWEEGDEEQKMTAAKALAKWRPGFDAQEQAVQQMKSEINASRTCAPGVKAEKPGRSSSTPVSVAPDQ